LLFRKHKTIVPLKIAKVDITMRSTALSAKIVNPGDGAEFRWKLLLHGHDAGTIYQFHLAIATLEA
jgi:hypothetical protein